MILTATRSFTLPPGFKNSALPKIWNKNQKNTTKTHTWKLNPFFDSKNKSRNLFKIKETSSQSDLASEGIRVAIDSVPSGIEIVNISICQGFGVGDSKLGVLSFWAEWCSNKDAIGNSGWGCIVICSTAMESGWRHSTSGMTWNLAVLGKGLHGGRPDNQRRGAANRRGNNIKRGVNIGEMWMRGGCTLAVRSNLMASNQHP